MNYLIDVLIHNTKTIYKDDNNNYYCSIKSEQLSSDMFNTKHLSLISCELSGKFTKGEEFIASISDYTPLNHKEELLLNNLNIKWYNKETNEILIPYEIQGSIVFCWNGKQILNTYVYHKQIFIDCFELN